jgi:hypothetical protein
MRAGKYSSHCCLFVVIALLLLLTPWSKSFAEATLTVSGDVVVVVLPCLSSAAVVDISDKDIPHSNSSELSMVVECNTTANATVSNDTVVLNISRSNLISRVTIDLRVQLHRVIVASNFSLDVYLNVNVNTSTNEDVLVLPALLFSENMTSPQNATVRVLGSGTALHRATTLWPTGLLISMPSFFTTAAADAVAEGSFLAVEVGGNVSLDVVDGNSLVVLGNVANESWAEDAVVEQGHVSIKMGVGAALTLRGSTSRAAAVEVLTPRTCMATLVCSTSTNTSGGQFALASVQVPALPTGCVLGT